MFTALRRLGAALLGAAAVLAGGCGNSGKYQVSWRFTSVFTSGSCGKAGVSAIAIAQTEQGGGQGSQVVPCAPGTFVGGLDHGTWTLVLTALDGEGHTKTPADSGFLRGQPAAPVVITDGDLTVVTDPVVLPPLPECQDGVDNDRDGRVDLDDLTCAGDANGAAECVAAAGSACPDTTP